MSATTATAAASGKGLLPAGLLAKLHAQRGLIVPIGFVVMIAVILIPLPPAALDMLISVNIALAVLVLLTTLHVSKALEFSVFPSLLLATTLFRLVLNVASTRLILTADANSPEEAMNVAGQVIRTFGAFVAGGEIVVGVIIFLILMVVQFMVVTKGAGRISEVAARFTLDAMPGKQMAIDSDLNAGLINETEARDRRQAISQEADFYGSMDGASKFVKGDAVAGIIITAINIVGGFAIGMLQRGWPAMQTAETFTILTIGDGLTSQIPSLVISIASALIVTQSSQDGELGMELTKQLAGKPRGLFITAVFLLALAATPLPTVPLVATALGLGGLGFVMLRGTKRAKQRIIEQSTADAPPIEPPPVEDLLRVDVLELEVGYGLVRLVDAQQGGDLLDRITAVRRQLAVEIGLVMPPVRIRDNMQLSANKYRVKIRGNAVAETESKPGKLLAMDSGITSGRIDGEPTREPAFGLDAWWIDPAMRQRAETMNYTVVDPSSVIATHITELTRRHAAEMLTREEVNNLVEGLKGKCPKLVEELVPEVVKPGELQKVLQNLLRERVPIRDMETIVETLGDWTRKTTDLDVLTEYVRHALRRTICHLHASPDDRGVLRLACVTLDPTLEDQINAYVDRGPAGTTITMPARVISQITTRIAESLQKLTAAGHPPVVVASPQVRGVVRQIIETSLPTTAVLGYNEVSSDVEVESLALVPPVTDRVSGAPAAA
jgi:flagellar biosynthesis protein FlhA